MPPGSFGALAHLAEPQCQFKDNFNSITQEQLAQAKIAMRNKEKLDKYHARQRNNNK
jgi:hypothetical protein